MSPATTIDGLLTRFEPSRRKLAAHPLYSAIGTLADMRVFMEHHVYAVWDFMSLLKALQRHLTCTESAWRPVGTPDIRRMVNELILEEETDEIDGVSMSHFELYRRAMRDAGADTGPMDRLLDLTGLGLGVEAALQRCEAPAASARFVRATFTMIGSGKPHVIAAAFTFGREDAIPTMFRNLVASVSDRDGALATFTTYLERHIELDGGSHGAKAIRMLVDLCAGDPVKWTEATEAAILAVDARLDLWDSIHDAVAAQHHRPTRPEVPRRLVAVK